jgi:predicted DNA-binding transcriptional regulator AlpA
MALYATKSPSTIWRNVKKGLIPAPVKLTPQISAWRVGDLRAALTKRGAA